VASPEGKLTPVQHEILDVVWEAGDAGATVTQIWTAVAARRSVTRTTILNLVDRLDRRGWLRRCKQDDGYHYTATVDRAATAQLLARDFVDEYFGGSTSEMVLSLLGGKRLTPEDVKRLRRLFDANGGDEAEKPR
jgi:BlaI family transcriptional regulator, penicillinase repressor